MKYLFVFLSLFLLSESLQSQEKWLSGRVVKWGTEEAVKSATVEVEGGKQTVITSAEGRFRIKSAWVSTDSSGENLKLVISAVGYETLRLLVTGEELLIQLQPSPREMDEVVVTGTMRAVQRSASPVPVEVYSPQFFRKNPTPTIFDALQLVNGVRPQLNCNVCNTGDIHINGLEGPYTMVLIDGMPIVSSLASVYGLQGIPNSLVERIEIVKGPASSLYGSEAIGGLINIITKHPLKAPVLSMEYNGTSQLEHNFDAGFSYRAGKKVRAMTGVNYYNATHRFDQNADNFTDITLQNRFSVFQKLNLERKDNRLAALAFRFISEDRWGGEMNWTRKFRGGDSVYGEQISTNRAELIGNYQLPSTEKLVFSFSANSHSHRSAYGTTIFNADQHIGFGQLTWEKDAGENHQLLAGMVARYTWYDDNTPATADITGAYNRPDRILLPGIFLQDDIGLGTDHRLLLGARYDYDKRHGNIFTPRLAWKWSLSDKDHLRFNLGTGFRVVNLFTEDHAALTGARKVEINGKLKPERSYNGNLNYTRKFILNNGYVNLEAAAWYTYFSNRILPDYDTDPDKIIYANLDGYAESRGFSVNMEADFRSRLRLTSGFTLQDVSITEKDSGGKRSSRRQLLTETWSGTWTISYTFEGSGWALDYTGNIYGPMLLPLLSPADPRKPKSPVWSIQNIQLSYKNGNGLEWFGGVKNLLNFTPARNNPFIIARANDPFDKQVVRDTEGAVVATPDNPHALSFDPNYVYAPNQGRKIFLGFRFILKEHK